LQHPVIRFATTTTPPPSHSPCYAGLAMKFLPTGSHRTKDAAGQLIDNALILRSIGGLYRGIVGGDTESNREEEVG
jgi:hypothetical protein